MNNYKTKIRISLTIDKEIYEKFLLESKKKSVNKSAYVENCIKAWLIENVKNA